MICTLLGVLSPLINLLTITKQKKIKKPHFKYFQKKVHHPYPLFQSDDPNVDDNIILLDNDQGTKETGVYTHNNYDQDYAEYDYKGTINGFCLFSSNLLHKFKTLT